MKFTLSSSIGVLFLTAVAVVASAQVSSHSSTSVAMASSAPVGGVAVDAQALDKPVVRVNGVVLTERDVVREMYSMFPYARQHNGFPKDMEPEIRKGAKSMIVFEELVYQEALRRKMVVSPERMKRAEAQFRKQYGTQKVFDEYLRMECKGSEQVLHQKIRRSLLIDALLNAEVNQKSTVSPLELRAYYDKNPAQFKHPETFSLQTISIVPPQNPSAAVKKEARKNAEDAWQKAKLTKSYKEFGLLAEKYSEDDWHVNMGDHKAVERDKLPPPIVKAALAMKPGQVSDLIVLGDNYTIFRLNAHSAAGKYSFEEAKKQLRSDLEKAKFEQLRSDLAKKLSKTAKVEEM